MKRIDLAKAKLESIKLQSKERDNKVLPIRKKKSDDLIRSSQIIREIEISELKWKKLDRLVKMFQRIAKNPADFINSKF